MAISMDGMARSLYLLPKSLVHPVMRSKNCSHCVSAPIFVNKGHVWCSYCNLVNKYKKLFQTRGLNPTLSIYVCRIGIHEFNIHTNGGY